MHAAYAQLAVLGFNYTAADQSEEVTRLRIANGECHVAVDGLRLVGTLLFRPAETAGGCAYYDRPGVSVMAQFAVLPSYQRSGIGTRLLAEAETRARATGAAEVALDTAEGASHLIRWYERKGFCVVDRVQWDGKTYRSVIMSKRLVSTAAG